MTINLISKATVKTELGISAVDTTYDAAITAMIPKVSADVRRILNTNFDDYKSAEFDGTAATIKMYDSGDSYSQGTGEKNYEAEKYPLGLVVYHPNLPDDTYLVSFHPDTGLHTLSNTPDDEGDYVYPTINIAQWSTIAKMIWYKISELGTTYGERTVESETYGKISKSYGSGGINTKWNYPQQLIDDLGTPYIQVG